MSDLQWTLAAVATSLLSSGILLYLANDESERQWHEKKLQCKSSGKKRLP